ncbi:MAG: hypothetical protein V7637_2028 [Mycobacteriales bacterium]|jgi:hypothetical protein
MRGAAAVLQTAALVVALVGVGPGSAAADRPGVLPPEAFTASATISPDGRYIAYSLNNVPPGASYLRDLRTGTVVPLGVSALFSSAAVTADDRLLAYTLAHSQTGHEPDHTAHLGGRLLPLPSRPPHRHRHPPEHRAEQLRPPQ